MQAERDEEPEEPEEIRLKRKFKAGTCFSTDYSFGELNFAPPWLPPPDPPQWLQAQAEGEQLWEMWSGATSLGSCILKLKAGEQNPSDDTFKFVPLMGEELVALRISDCDAYAKRHYEIRDKAGAEGAALPKPMTHSEFLEFKADATNRWEAELDTWIKDAPRLSAAVQAAAQLAADAPSEEAAAG